MTVGSQTVLVVEDEESFVEALQVGLRGEGSGSRWREMALRRSTSSTSFALTSCCST